MLILLLPQKLYCEMGQNYPCTKEGNYLNVLSEIKDLILFAWFPNFNVNCVMKLTILSTSLRNISLEFISFIIFSSDNYFSFDIHFCPEKNYKKINESKSYEFDKNDSLVICQSCVLITNPPIEYFKFGVKVSIVFYYV